MAQLFQSTLSMRRATRNGRADLCHYPISIHALHEESDFKWINLPPYIDISIHALHEESDRRRWANTTARAFQSTLSMRRATANDSVVFRDSIFQSTLSMRRATSPRRSGRCTILFQSTLSMRRATQHQQHRLTALPISIHALHEESDSAAGHFCPLFETQASCLALSISNNTADTTNNMSKTSNWLSVSF